MLLELNFGGISFKLQVVGPCEVFFNSIKTYSYVLVCLCIDCVVCGIYLHDAELLFQLFPLFKAEQGGVSLKNTPSLLFLNY